MTGAMYSAVAGLRSHMSKLNVIGNNIANVNTYSYKSTRMTFEESISATVRSGSNSAGTNTGGVNPTQYGFGSNISSIDMNMSTSTYSPTGYAMDCMIDGNGFFLTGDKTGAFDTVSDLSSLSLSRMGDFGLSDDGYLRDQRGQIIYGFAMVQNPDYNPYATADEIAANPNVAEAEILSTDLVPLRLPLAAATPTVQNGGISYIQRYDDEGVAIDGEFTEIYNWQEGEAVFEVLSGTDPTNGNAQTNLSSSPYYNTYGTEDMEDDEWEYAWGGPGPSTDTYSWMGEAVNFTQNVIRPADLADDETGYPLGVENTRIVANTDDYPIQMSAISIDSNGQITGINATTGDTVVVGYVAIATVDNSAGVTNIGSCYYQALGGSGNIRVSVLGGIAEGLYFKNKTPTLNEETGQYEFLGIDSLDTMGIGAGSSIISNGLEASNVDLAVEFSEMITTQRGYQANTRVVTVTDSMLEELVNLKR